MRPIVAACPSGIAGWSGIYRVATNGLTDVAPVLAKVATTWTGARRRSIAGDTEATMTQVALARPGGRPHSAAVAVRSRSRGYFAYPTVCARTMR